jgi:hypothetical protein
MRTVTFSNAKVAEVVNSNFVPVWYNRGQGFHNCEKSTENWIFNANAECYPTKNICTFFMTPDLDVVYYVSGYYAPDVFLDIVSSVRKVHAAKERKAMADAHREASADLSRRLEDVDKACANPKTGPDPLAPFGSCKYEKDEHKHKLECLNILRQCYQYRKVVHDSLTDGGTVPLDKVQHDYKFGNSFSEEARAIPEASLGKPAAPQKPGTAAAVKKK